MLCVSNVLLSSSKKIFSKPSMQRFTNRTANFLTFVHPACRIPVNRNCLTGPIQFSCCAVIRIKKFRRIDNSILYLLFQAILCKPKLLPHLPGQLGVIPIIRHLNGVGDHPIRAAADQPHPNSIPEAKRNSFCRPNCKKRANMRVFSSSPSVSARLAPARRPPGAPACAPGRLPARLRPAAGATAARSAAA